MPSNKLCGFCRSPKELVGECLGEPICEECKQIYGKSYHVKDGEL